MFYGTLNNDIFTVTATEELPNAKSGATHTLILFDNDTQEHESNDLNNSFGRGENASYKPNLSYTTKTYGDEEVIFDEMSYWIEGVVVSNVINESRWTVSMQGSDQLLFFV